MSSFHVDGRIAVKLDFDLAIRLGEFILAKGSEDKQIQALAHVLVNMDDKSSTEPPTAELEGVPDPMAPSARKSQWVEGREGLKTKKPRFAREKVFVGRANKVRWGRTD